VGPVLLAADRTRRGVADLTAGCIYPEQTGRGGATVITGAGAVPCRKDCPGCFGACCCTGSRGGRPVHDRGLGSGSAGNRLSGAGWFAGSSPGSLVRALRGTTGSAPAPASLLFAYGYSRRDQLARARSVRPCRQ